MTTSIKEIKALQILDSRGNPTVRVKVVLEGGAIGVASVPSGASTGEHEAVELRDGKEQYLGNSVLSAVRNVNEKLNAELAGYDASNQQGLDKKMLEIDGTNNKGSLGANAILGVSLAAAKAAAVAKGVELYEHIKDLSGSDEFDMPRPMMNIINGGKHADSGLDFQEFMIMPKKSSAAEMVRVGAEVFHHLKKILEENKLSVGVGDEGGFAPRIPEPKRALQTIIDAINAAGYTPGVDVEIALDAAAASFFNKEKNVYETFEGEKSSDELLTMYHQLIAEFPIVSIEDPFDENDWDGFIAMTEALGEEVTIVGDDLFVTNIDFLKRGIKEKAANAILIKVNQIGTLTETLDAIKMAKEAGFKTIVSHRSGETEDTFIADLAYGSAAGEIKTGSLSRSDRVAKYNRLLEIEANF